MRDDPSGGNSVRPLCYVNNSARILLSGRGISTNLLIRKEPRMRRFLIAAVAISSFVLSASVALAEHEKDKKDKDSKGWNGVLIDKACSAKMKTDKDAADHTKSCAKAAGCAKSGYGLFKDDK